MTGHAAQAPPDLSEAERLLWQAFSTGAWVDAGTLTDPSVRAAVIRALLLGAGPRMAGHLPALLLRGMKIKGPLDLAFASLDCSIRIESCHFEERLGFYGARLRQLSLEGSTFPGLDMSRAVIDANLRLIGCTATDGIKMFGTRLTGALLLSQAHVTGRGVAIDGTLLDVGSDVVGQGGLVCEGELRLLSAKIGAALRLEGARLNNAGGRALDARNLTVGTIANCCDGLQAEGEMSFHNAVIRDNLCLENAQLSNPHGYAISCRHLKTERLILAPSRRIVGEVDLRYANVGLLRDRPSALPDTMHLDGLRYERLWDVEQDDVGTAHDRLQWLRLDKSRYVPQAYEQLAGMYRNLGRDADARTVLLAKQRHGCRLRSPAGRIWGTLQDIAVGYGYRPGRAIGWLAAMLLIGSIYFGVSRPNAATMMDTPDFNPVVYTLDLLLPLVSFGQESAFYPHGLQAWIAYGFICVGWILATTVAAGATRVLRRDS
jgi:hypothetical protein